MQQEIVQQNGLPCLGLQVDHCLWGRVLGLLLGGEKVPLVDDAVLVAARHDLHTAGGCGRVVECRPHGDDGIGVDAPANPHVLVPRQFALEFGRFVHKHRAKDRDFLADVAAGDLVEEGVLDIGEEERVLL